MPGYLEQIHFEDGALVKKGDLLFTIQQDQYKAQLQQAQAQLQAQQAARDLRQDRGRPLHGAVSSSTRRRRSTSITGSIEQKTAEANILGAQRRRSRSPSSTSATPRCTAPFDGQMGKHLVDPGNMVGGDGQQAALAEITQLDPIYVVANISSQQALQIRANLDQRRLTLDELHKIPIEAALVGRDRLSRITARSNMSRRRSIPRPARC